MADQLKTSKKRKHREPDLYDQVLHGELPTASTSAITPDQDSSLSPPEKTISLQDLKSFNSKADNTGIVYLSRIPPGMGPSKVKHLLEQYGKIGRVYLQRDERDQDKKGKSKHHSHRFTEGWVEFADKKIARATAQLLNVKPIGGKKGTKWRDDVWTIKYLPRFKWAMLSEQVALEANTHASLLRAQLAQSKREQASYLNQVERANTDKKKQEKKAKRQAAAEERGEKPAQKDEKPPKKQRTYEQRQKVEKKPLAGDQKLSTVLDSLF